MNFNIDHYRKYRAAAKREEKDGKQIPIKT